MTSQKRGDGHAHDDQDVEPWQTDEFLANREAWRGDLRGDPNLAKQERGLPDQEVRDAIRPLIADELQRAVLEALSHLSETPQGFLFEGKIRDLDRRVLDLETRLASMLAAKELAEKRNLEFQEDFLRLKREYGEPIAGEMPEGFDFGDELLD